MKKNLSVPQIAFIGLLIVAAVYLFVFHFPIKNESEELNNRILDLQTQTDVNEAKLVQMSSMKGAINNAANSNARPLPVYNNSNNIITELNSILDSSSTIRYDINFGDDVENDNLVRREIRINFVADSYESAEQKLTSIRDSANCYVISDLNIVAGEPDADTGLATYSVSVNLATYEYKA